MDRDELLLLGRNFMECRIFLTAAELNLFSLLQEHPLTVPDLIQRTN